MNPLPRFPFLAALLLALPFSLHADQPNLVLILTDDMGYADLPAFGASEIETPAIDRLCTEGTKLTSAYVSAPICVPSRMGLLTGRQQQRFGVYNNVYSVEENRIWVQERTLADELGDAGYRTGLVGKWHLSGNRTPWKLPPPHERGFDEFVGIGGGMDDFHPGTELLRHEDGDYHTFPSPAYLTDFFGEEAVAFIDRHEDDPFFLFLSFNAPHAPLQALDSDRDAIKADWISPERRTYAAMVRAIDRNIGRVLDALDRHDLAEDTLVVFLNDNGGGGNNAAPHTRNTARNVPYRGHKFDLSEGGIRTPMILRWPGRVPAGDTFDGLASSLDILPTALAAADLPAPDDREIDGVDLLPWVRGEREGDPHAVLFWQQRQWPRPNQRSPPERNLHQWAIRKGPWKALRSDQPVRGDGDRAWELYDLRRDPGELQDVATEYPEVINELAQDFTTWQEKMPEPPGRD